ncbi:MAG: hypothetical protein KY429_07175 [Actinobacteria bacterium]|nr:hypothetical protein [Actinomycetota bacterium]
MTIGGSIFLLVLGAIFFFAMDATWGGLNMDTVGVILMIAGALGLFLSIFVWRPRRATVVEDRRVG